MHPFRPLGAGGRHRKVRAEQRVAGWMVVLVIGATALALALLLTWLTR